MTGKEETGQNQRIKDFSENGENSGWGGLSRNYQEERQTFCVCGCVARVYLHSLAMYMATYMALLELSMWTGWP